MKDDCFVFYVDPTVHGAVTKLCLPRKAIYGITDVSRYPNKCVIFVGNTAKYTVLAPYDKVRSILFPTVKTVGES